MGSICSPISEEVTDMEDDEEINTRVTSGTVEQKPPERVFMQERNLRSQQVSKPATSSEDRLNIDSSPMCKSFTPPAPSTPLLGKPMAGEPQIAPFALGDSKPSKPPSIDVQSSSPRESESVQVRLDCLVADNPKLLRDREEKEKRKKIMSLTRPPPVPYHQEEKRKQIKSLPRPPPVPHRRTPSPQLSAGLPDISGGTPSAELPRNSDYASMTDRVPLESLHLPIAPKRPPLPPGNVQSTSVPMQSKPPPLPVELMQPSMVNTVGPPPVPSQTQNKDWTPIANSNAKPAAKKVKRMRKRKNGARGLPRPKQVSTQKSLLNEFRESKNVPLGPPTFTGSTTTPPKPPLFVTTAPSTWNSTVSRPPPAPPMFKAK